MSQCLEAEQISRVYATPEGDVHVLQAVDVALPTGASMAIMGPSGSGKSTLLHVLAGWDAPTTGVVRWGGEAITAWSTAQRDAWRRRHLGFVYQSVHLLPDFSAVENVVLAGRIGGLSGAQAQQRAEEVLEQVGLAHRLHHRPGHLSGGERQRVGIARALVHRPTLVMADEPTGQLDAGLAHQVWALLETLRQAQGTALLVVTHDPALAARTNHQWRLGQGRLHPLAGASAPALPDRPAAIA